MFQMHLLKGDWKMLLNTDFRESVSTNIRFISAFNFIFQFNILDGDKQ